jgi:3-hydroxybutyryl-CoA dehydrogenase
LSITELAKSVGTPQQFIGLHFLNPAAAIKLVEIVEGKDTSLELQKSRKLCRRPRQNPDSNK